MLTEEIRVATADTQQLPRLDKPDCEDFQEGQARILQMIAANKPLALEFMTTSVFAYASDGGKYPDLPFRYAGLAMCSIFALGLLVLPFLPETKDKPLPE